MSMDSSKMIFDAVIRDTAAKVIGNLDVDAKKEILTESVARILKDMKFDWRVASIIEEEAKAFAREYVKRPEVQEKIRAKVLDAVDEVMDGLSKSVSKDIEGNLKSEYRKWTSD